MHLRIALLLSLCSATRLAALDDITSAELARVPAPGRVTALVDEAERTSWGSQVAMLRRAAFAAYESGRGAAAAWYYLYRWADLLGQPDGKAVRDWVDAVKTAKVGHANMATRYQWGPGSAAAHLSRELQLHALGSAAFSEEFFTTLQPVDHPLRVLDILQQLYTADSAHFADYQNLALAIAVVFDVPPPPFWPHGQVSASVLPREFPAPSDAFAYWIKLDRSGQSLHRFKRLSAVELKYVVDSPAPFVELDWARSNVPWVLSDFAKAYDLIRYRKDRLVANQSDWKKPDYRLATIRQEGGICVDQAYFAYSAGKAKGIPTILLRGAGLDGRHAWFGYLGGDGWVLDCGRYAEQKFVVGLAWDPQTWANVTDHELVFLSEHFHALPGYKFSQLHTAFAGEYLRTGDLAGAVRAAREAVNREHRNLEAWRMLLRVQTSAGVDAGMIEITLHEAAIAFQRYPDIEAAFKRQIAQSLRARGELSAANHEEQRLTRKYSSDRTDLSIRQSTERMERSIREEDLADQIRTFKHLLDTEGRGASIDFFDQVVAPFINHLQGLGETPAALQMLERARQTLRVESGRQLEMEMNALATRLKTGKN